MVTAIVLAGGSGNRMNSNVAKQYLKIKGKEVLYYSLQVFQKNDDIQEIILVTRESDVDYCRKNIVNKYDFHKVKAVIVGGKERYNSVYNGIGAASGDIVMIHDGARPFITDEMIEASIDAVKKYGACTVGVPVKDTIKIVDENGMGVDTPDRDLLYQIQTPQTFQRDMLIDAYDKMFKDENHKITDDTMLVEQYGGVQSKVIFGAYENIKITTPEDLEIADKLVEKNMEKI